MKSPYLWPLILLPPRDVTTTPGVPPGLHFRAPGRRSELETRRGRDFGWARASSVIVLVLSNRLIEDDMGLIINLFGEEERCCVRFGNDDNWKFVFTHGGWQAMTRESYWSWSADVRIDSSDQQHGVQRAPPKKVTEDHRSNAHKKFSLVVVTYNPDGHVHLDR